MYKSSNYEQLSFQHSSNINRQNRPRQRQASSRNENSSQSTENASQSSRTEYQICPKCNKNVKVKNDGNLYSHSPCNQNTYDVLRVQDDENNNIVDEPEPIAPQSNHQPAVQVPTRAARRTNTPASTQDTIRTIVDTYQGKKTGPKFRTANVWAATFESHLHKLHHEVNSSNDIESITTIIVQLLLCTPPDSKIQESIDNTLNINEDCHELSQLDILLPSHIQDNPKLAASIIAAIKNDLNHGNVSKATRKLSPGGLQSLKHKPVRDTITAKYHSRPQSTVQNRQIENIINIYDEDMINFSDETTQIATIKHIFKKNEALPNLHMVFVTITYKTYYFIALTQCLDFSHYYKSLHMDEFKTKQQKYYFEDEGSL